jgi:Protein of unknown function (DUF2752)
MNALWRTRALYAAPFLVAGFLALWSPSEDGPTICPFALATGMACPGCGMTRAVGYLARGDLTSALTYHPLVILVALQGIAGWGWLMLRKSDRVQPLSNRFVSAILVGTAVSLFAVWVMRAVVGTLPPV